MTTATADLAIDLHDVEKVFRTGFGKARVHALRGIRMQVERGAIFGLLGPNGAGKSTLVKIMLTIVRATRATGTVLGHPVGTKDALRQVGFLPEHHRMPAYLTGRQAVDFYGALAGISRRERRKRIPALLDLVGMDDRADRKIGGYSKGMMQRIGLAQALVNDPDLVILDEPTDGVDPVGRREIRDLLVRLRGEGKTVFVNSHILSELEMICDRVAILVDGQLATQGTISELTASSRRYEVVIDGPPPDWIAESEGLAAEPAVESVTAATRLIRSGDDADAVQPLIDRLRGDRRVIRSVRPMRESLEDLFVRSVGPDAAAASPAPAPAGSNAPAGGDA